MLHDRCQGGRESAPRALHRFAARAAKGVGPVLLVGCVAAGAARIPGGSRTRASAPWEQLLGAVGLTRDTARFDLLDMASFGGGELRLAWFNAVHQDPLRIPSYARSLRQSVLTAAPSTAELAMIGGLRMGEGTRRTLIADPVAALAERAGRPHALAEAIGAIHSHAAQPLDPKRMARLRAQSAQVPPDVARAAALILQAELAAIRLRERALARVPSARRGDLWSRLSRVVPQDGQEPLDAATLDLLQSVDMKLLLAGGIDLCAAVDRAAGVLIGRRGGERFDFDWSTPLGEVRLSGAGRHVWTSASACLLRIDTEGDDLYVGGVGSSQSLDHPAGVCVDIAGNDRYLSHPALEQTAVAALPRPGQADGPLARGTQGRSLGSGTLGWGILVDCAGNDLYRGLGGSMGAALFGMGILQDRAGDDRYDACFHGQGAATFGVGVLADLSGRDEYRCFSRAQGYGGTKGFGLLVDAGQGDDLYEANDSVIDFPSPQDKAHNVSLAQGAGYGRRADYSDGHSLAGGIGALVDGGGSNRFSCGVFGQGVGYWYGAGILSAGDGPDAYEGVWYVQGASAHFAVGVHHDVGGNDRYRATHNMAQGAGHDFGPGFLLDEAGNDRHEAPNLSLGGGNANGFGFFWDRAGDDVYVVRPSTTLGRGSIEASGRGTIRERCLTLGLFLDCGGQDTYPADLPWARNEAVWTMADSGPPPIPAVRGAGLDTDAACADP